RVDAPAAQSNDDNEGDALPTGDRRLVRAEFLSARHEGVSESEVEIESRRYAQTANGAPTLSHLLYLSGERVLVDGPTEGVTVPTPGRMVVEDRRSREGAAPSRTGGVASRGTTMFEWQGSFR